MHRRDIPGLLAAALVLGLGQPALASGDRERARAALAAGEILPLAEILARVERRYLGRPIKIELERESNRWIYEIKLLPPGGRVFEIELDAASGEVIRTKGPVQERP